jgi:hypothetical protein
MKKESSLRDLHQALSEKEGVPVSRQRFWTCIRRENQTIRPDQLFYCASDPDFDEALADINVHLDIAPFYNGGTKLCDVLLYMEEVPWQKCIRSVGNSAEKKSAMQISEADPGSWFDELEQAQANVSQCLLSPIPTTSILLFFKFYDPEEMTMHYVGSRVVSNQIQKKALIEQEILKLECMPLKVMQAIGENQSIAGDEDGLIEVKEEVKPTQVEALATDLTLEEMEIQNGDILIFQLRTPEAISKLQSKMQKHTQGNQQQQVQQQAQQQQAQQQAQQQQVQQVQQQQVQQVQQQQVQQQQEQQQQEQQQQPSANPNPKKIPLPMVSKTHCEIKEYYKHWLRKSKLAQAKGKLAKSEKPTQHALEAAASEEEEGTAFEFSYTFVPEPDRIIKSGAKRYSKVRAPHVSLALFPSPFVPS